MSSQYVGCRTVLGEGEKGFRVGAGGDFWGLISNPTLAPLKGCHTVR